MVQESRNKRNEPLVPLVYDPFKRFAINEKEDLKLYPSPLFTMSHKQNFKIIFFRLTLTARFFFTTLWQSVQRETTIINYLKDE